jgi:hypothetical protein
LCAALASTRAERDSLSEELKKAGADHRAELDRLTATSARLEKRYQQSRDDHETAHRSCKLLEVRIQELTLAQSQLESESRMALDAEKLIQVQLTEELERICSERRPDERVEPSEGEEATSSATASWQSSDIEVSHAEVAKLRRRLAEVEQANRDMSGVLARMGIRQAQRR